MGYYREGQEDRIQVSGCGRTIVLLDKTLPSIPAIAVPTKHCRFDVDWGIGAVLFWTKTRKPEWRRRSNGKQHVQDWCVTTRVILSCQ